MVLSCATEIHRHLGPCLLESAYEQYFCHEMGLHGIPFDRQKPLPLEYKGIKLDCGYCMDIVVDNASYVGWVKRSETQQFI
ncbi:MAG: GxxExxY protein [Planctomycetota bacterium]